MGQLVQKQLGLVSGSTYLQNLDMRYNIRGWLTSINNSTLTNDSSTTNTNGDTNDAFGMQILYDQTDSNLGNSPKYDGRVSAVKWMSLNGSGAKSPERAYKYTYDALNRYTAAAYIERASGSGAFAGNSGGFDETISYDSGGDITGLTRNSSSPGGSSHVQIDNLSYSYKTTTVPNELSSVSDASGNTLGFLGGSGTYNYDSNGNLTNEPYKGITTIAYNVLNKTDKMTFTVSPNRYLEYTYDAGGQLLRKRQYDNVSGSAQLQNTTDYIDGFVYLNGVLQYFAMPEGRVINTGSGSTVTLSPVYTISDQMGNVRVEFDNTGTSGTAKVRQENSYYPTGLIMANSPVTTPSNDNRTLYNGGSEWQKDYSNLPDYYQTFYRNYDAALARWIAVDPEAESDESMTPYQYAGNNPIMYNDPLGNIRPAPQDDPLTYSGHQGTGGDYFAAKFAEIDAWAAEDQQIKDEFDYMDDLGGGNGQRAQGLARDQRNKSATPAIAASNTANELRAETYLNLHWNPYGGAEISEGWYKSLPGHAERESYPADAKFYKGAWEDENNQEVGLFANQGWVHLSSPYVNVTFDPGADQLVDPRLEAYFNNLMKSMSDEITSINISSTTNHPSNSKRTAHRPGRAFDINYINGTHVSGDYHSAVFGIESDLQFDILFNHPGWLEDYGPAVNAKMINGGPVYAPWAVEGHLNPPHIHIAIQP
jgi:RHS repeat-associated protein